MGRTPTAVQFFESADIFANGAHSGQLDRVLAEQTEALAYRMGGNVKHYTWSSVLKATLSAANAWTELGYSSLSAYPGFPWQVTPGFTSLAGLVTLYSNARVPLCVRLRTDDLTDTVAETLGNPSAAKAPATPQQDRGLSQTTDWQYAAAAGFESSTYQCSVNPTVPSNGRVAVHVDVLATSLLVPVTAYLGYLVLLEQPDERAGL